MNNPAGPLHPAWKHGRSHDAIYQLWQNMWQRCSNPKSPEWKRYGGRGITICKRWASFDAFYDDVGDPPQGKTFDRLDSDGNYEPSNWRWATPLEQAQNRRNNILLTFHGRTMSVNYWKRTLKLDHGTIKKRMKMGLPIELVLKKGRLK